MATIEITDNCLAPEKDLNLKYSGPNPWDVVKKIEDAIKPYFHVSSVGWANTHFYWDRSGKNIDFFCKWYVKREFSRFSVMRIDIKVQGSFDKQTKMGNFTLKINANLLTEFSGWSILVKPIWELYSYLFYDKLRKQYIEKCREAAHGFRKILKEYFNLGSLPAPPAVGSLG